MITPNFETARLRFSIPVALSPEMKKRRYACCSVCVIEATYVWMMSLDDVAWMYATFAKTLGWQKRSMKSYSLAVNWVEMNALLHKSLPISSYLLFCGQWIGNLALKISIQRCFLRFITWTLAVHTSDQNMWEKGKLRRQIVNEKSSTYYFCICRRCNT